MSDYLPEDILVNILARLPVKTLLQFRCVSKTWYSLISSPSFITHHLNQKATSKNIHDDLLIFFKCRSSKYRKDLYFLYPDKDFLKSNGQVDFPLQPLYPEKTTTYLVGSSNGLFFIYQFYYDHKKFNYVRIAALWNPSIRKIVPIPTPTDTSESLFYFENYFGFGFDSINHEYKVVRVGYLLPRAHRSYGMKPKLPPLVEVYSMKFGCWRMVDNDLNCFIKKYSSSTFVNGACHWAANTEEWGGETNVIVFFNLADEKIGEMTFPDNFVVLVSSIEVNFTVTVFDGLLSLVAWSIHKSSVWTMKKYGDSQSWVKLFNVEHLRGHFINDFVGFNKTGDMFLVDQAGTELVSYSTIKNRSFRIWGTKRLGFIGRFFMDSYIESLALLNEADHNASSMEHSSYVAQAADTKKRTEEKTGNYLLNFFFKLLN